MEKKVEEEAKALETERKSTAESSTEGSMRQQDAVIRSSGNQEGGNSNQGLYDGMHCDQ
jgi:hypothetical protein